MKDWFEGSIEEFGLAEIRSSRCEATLAYEMTTALQPGKRIFGLVLETTTLTH